MPASIDNIFDILRNLVQAVNAQTQAVKTGASLTYATGTWTPQLEFGGASTGITYSAQNGTYTQIGREITCRFHIVLTAVGSATGAATIAGLPFASNSDPTNKGAGGTLVEFLNLATSQSAVMLQVNPSSSAIALIKGGASTASLANTDFTATTELDGYFSYFV